jgi:integrase
MRRQDISLNKQRQVWVGNYRRGKKRTRYVLGSVEEFRGKTQEELQEVLNFRYKNNLERFERECKEEEDQGQYLNQLLEEWLESVASARDTKTVDHYRLDCSRFVEVAPPRVGQLSSAVQQVYYDHLRSLGLADTSINSAVRSVRVFLRWLSDKELLKHPVHLKALRTVKKRPQFYTAEQIQTMLEYCKDTPGRRYTLLYRCIWILSQTGMRGGELLNLTWAQVTMNRIKIVSSEDWKVKSRRDAWARYWAHLNELTASMRFVQTKCECRGPKPLHGFRAGVATELLRQGASPVHVQRLLRHEDLSTTMGYLDPDALEIENLVKGL